MRCKLPSCCRSSCCGEFADLWQNCHEKGSCGTGVACFIHRSKPDQTKQVKKTLIALLGFTLFGVSASQAQVLITQYYEGTSNNKWIELTNIGSSAFDLSTLTLSLWTNANAEAYKTNGTPSGSLVLSGSLGASTSFLLANSNAVLPAYATPDATSNTVINFNGNDSITLWSGATFATANIVDAIGFTNAGNEGANTSFYRANNGVGYDTTAGSTALSFPSVWLQASNADVDNALPGTDVRLGFSSVAVPAPGPLHWLASESLVCFTVLVVAERNFEIFRLTSSPGRIDRGCLVPGGLAVAGASGLGSRKR